MKINRNDFERVEPGVVHGERDKRSTSIRHKWRDVKRSTEFVIARRLPCAASSRKNEFLLKVVIVAESFPVRC